jgi:proteasome lid subunit RPN8/RPN11
VASDFSSAVISLARKIGILYRYVAFLDEVLHKIEHDVASFKPERGGALLGPVGQPVITEFIYDQGAQTSAMTFRPSRRLEEQVRTREDGDPRIEFKGILHSHPGTMSWPSDGDLLAYQDSLRGAPWLGRLVTPIVTVEREPTEAHDISLPSGTMSVFVAECRHGSQTKVAIQPAVTHVLPVARDLTALAEALGGAANPPSNIDVDGQLYVAGVITLPTFDLQLLAGPAYPFTAPIVIAAPRPGVDGTVRGEPRLGIAWNGSDTPSVRGLSFPWDLQVPDDSRLLRALLRDDSRQSTLHDSQEERRRFSKRVVLRIAEFFRRK